MRQINWNSGLQPFTLFWNINQQGWGKNLSNINTLAKDWSQNSYNYDKKGHNLNAYLKFLKNMIVLAIFTLMPGISSPGIKSIS